MPIVVISLMDGSLFLVIRVDAARGPSTPSLDRIAFGPLPGADCRISDWQRLSQEVSERVGQQTEGWVFFTSRGPDHLRYEECIGAKKHLVTSPPTDPPPGSKSFATAEYVQWWKRPSGDGVALSAGIISLVRGR